jgi:WD40 repeat protein
VNKDDYKTLVKSTQISDNVSNVISSLDFVPGTNNKYLVAGADNSIKVYDFEAEQIVHTFPTDYTSYCDCVKFVTLLDQEQVENSFALISRGVETVNEDTNRTLRYYIFNIIEPQANSKCQLHRLKMIKTPGRGKKKNTEVISFELETVHTYLHPEFTSNSWLIKINTNGRYLFSPTSNGKIFIWNMATTKLAAILHDHGDEEVRDLLLHPTKPFLFTCGDDASVKVYKSEPKAAKKVVPNGEEKKDEEMGEKENDTMEETDD